MLVFDDLTELLAAQRLAAWREVAQRIAHEIKNPLTPIQLSAQRLRRRLAGRLPDDGGLLDECTATIIGEVEGLRRLVDEFSRFARMPSSARDRRTSTGCWRACSGSTARRIRPSSSAPTSRGPADARRRRRPAQAAVLNLVDNAVEAGATEVVIATHWDGEHVQVVIADNGPGIPADLRDRVFLPYFSTKTTGMGLGLPIVHQIVSDHGGRIEVEDNAPAGPASRSSCRCSRERPAAPAPVLDVAGAAPVGFRLRGRGESWPASAS